MSKTPAKQKIIEATKQLMISRGYKATTVDEIVKLAGVAKGSFYHAFKSKEELTIAALEDYKVKGWAIVASGSYTTIEDPVQRAIAFVQFIEDHSSEIWAHGCLLGTIAIEVADSYPDVLNTVDKLFSEYEKAMAIIFTLALKDRGIKTVSGRDLGIHFLAIIEGSIIAAKSHSTPKYLAQGISNFKRYLTLLLGEKTF